MSGSTSMAIDAMDNTFLLLPDLLAFVVRAAARDVVDRFSARLVALSMVGRRGPLPPMPGRWSRLVLRILCMDSEATQAGGGSQRQRGGDEE